jgi:hypothetical protein
MRKHKYMVMSGDRNAGQSRNIETDTRSFEWMEQLKYLGTNPRNRHSIQEEIKNRSM